MNGDHDPRADLPVPNRRPAGGVRGGGYVPREVVEPTVVYEPPPPHRSLGGDPAMRKDLGLVLFVVGALVIGLVTWNLAGAVTSAALTPTPSSPVALATASPSPSASSSAPASAPASATPSASPSVEPSPTATPKPVRKAMNHRIDTKPAAVFATEYTDKWCAAAAVQIVLNINGPESRIDTSKARQAKIRRIEVDLTTRKDSRNGGAGPLGMVATLNQLGKVDYALRIYNTRDQAIFASAKAIRKTGHPVILLAWRGAHSWVMTGFRADADPAIFKNAKISGTYIIDPWYPRVSSIWGRSDKPGVFQDTAEMKRNYRAWRRPEGKYPTRDGNYLAIIPLN